MTMCNPSVEINNRMYYSVDQVTKLLDCSKKNIQRKIKKNLIRYLYYKRRYFFLPEWVTEYLDSLVVEPRIIFKSKKEGA